MNTQEHLYSDHILPFAKVLADIEYYGIPFDESLRLRLDDEYQAKLKILSAEVRAEAGGINISSPKQLGNFLFHERGYKPIKLTDKKQEPSVDLFSVLILEHFHSKDTVLQRIVEYKRLSKLHNTYIEGLADDIKKSDGEARIYPTYFQLATSGRLRCARPNIQQFPRNAKIRSLIKAPDGYDILSADWSQLELRFAAMYSKDAAMIEYFSADKDIHRLTASHIFNVPEEKITKEQRYVGKTVNFSCLFFVEAPRLQGVFLVDGDIYFPVAECERFIGNFRSTFNGFTTWTETVKAKVKQSKCVENIYGRKRRFPNWENFSDSNLPYDRKIIQSYEREAINHLIQSSSSGDFANMKVLQIHNWLKENCKHSRIIVLMHDGLLLETKKDETDKVEEYLHKTMPEKNFHPEIPLPIEVKRGQTWGDC